MKFNALPKMSVAGFVALLACQPAIAGDATPSSSANWSGIFVGGSLGGAWNPTSYVHTETAGVGGPATNNERFSTNGSSFLGGLHIGAQQQIDAFVIGAEGGYDFFNARDSRQTNLNGIPRIRETRLNGMWYIAGRLGYAVDRALPYVKLGYANSELNYTNTRIADGVVVGQSSSRVGGFLVGAGLDFALTDNWVVGGEYNFAKFDVGSQQQMRAGVPVSAFNGSNNVQFHSVTARLSYKF
ncbi:outer membrane immunogenic protein [Rhizobium aquaticum]|uniref:Outer membrane immunogenic protein n=1 Tax=Rhizobium aquaticum TaxID=1549636 RepID=A0ABV2IU87_9HYPH